VIPVEVTALGAASSALWPRRSLSFERMSRRHRSGSGAIVDKPAEHINPSTCRISAVGAGVGSADSAGHVTARAAAWPLDCQSSLGVVGDCCSRSGWKEQPGEGAAYSARYTKEP